MSGQAGIAPRVGAGLVAVVFLVGMAARSLIGTDSSNGAPTDTPQSGQDQDRGPGLWTIDDDGIPMGFARTMAGAVAAAASYDATGEALLDLPPTQLPQAIPHFASAETAERRIAVLTDQLDAVRDVLSA